MKYARIEDNVALEVFSIPADTHISDCLHPELVARFTLVPDNVTAGSVLTNGVWKIAEVPAVVLPTPDEGTVDKRITRLAFIDRFTMDEWIAVDVATASVPTMKYFITKINAARYIDLARLETRNGVKLLKENGLLTEARVVEILDSPIRDIERLDGAGI